jgi:radical SAM superfamily enzyme YgiQ (UPF0313 family)
MNVLLIYPKIPETFWSFSYVLSFVRRKASMPPLGLLTVANMVPGSWELRLRDLNVTRLKDSDLKWADMVFISAMLVQRESTEEVIRRAKAMGTKIVAGGPLFSIMADEFDDVDHLVLGEAEGILPQFLSDLEKGTPAHMYQAASKPDVADTPLPRWDLIGRLKDYNTMPVQFSRGCPFDCEFCDITALYGRKPRTKSPSQMLEEMNFLYNFGWRGSVFVVDDNFIGNKKAAKDFLKELAEWCKEREYPFQFLTEASINLADDQELMDLMTAAGFNSVFLGIETPAEESLAECGKVQNQKRDLISAVQTIQKNGMEVQGGFIVGFDNDPPDIFDRQINFIQESGIVTAMVGLLSAIPGTRLYNRLEKENRIIKTDSMGNNCENDALNFVPTMDRETLLSGYNRLVKTIYEPRAYYQRVRVFLANYTPKKKGRQLQPIKIYAFFMALWHLGIRDVGSTKRHFWSLLFHILIRKPKLLVEAVVFSVYGLHFRRVLSESVDK